MKAFAMVLFWVIPVGIGSAAELAKVNGRVITDKELQNALGGLNEGQRQSLLKDPNNRREILMNLIDQEVLAQTAEKEKIDQSADYKAAVEQFRRQYLIQALLNRNVDSQLTENAVKKYYELHRNRYTTDQVHVQHILIADESKAREMLKKAKEPEADFQALAEAFSRDPSAKNNRGDIGFIHLNSPYVDEFKEAAFSGKAGEIVGPVKTLFGYHLIKVVEKKMGKQLPLEEVEFRVKNDLQRALRANYVEKLRMPAQIQVIE